MQYVTNKHPGSYKQLSLIDNGANKYGLHGGGILSGKLPGKLIVITLYCRVGVYGLLQINVKYQVNRTENNRLVSFTATA